MRHAASTRRFRSGKVFPERQFRRLDAQSARLIYSLVSPAARALR
jgi:hypothetical protein